ncbi:MAG: glycosyltransferase family 2 protein [Bacteroidota bacterium]
MYWGLNIKFMHAVSVIIPTFNSVATLPRAIDSVLAQTRPADEIIVVNDGSTDDTESVIADRYPRARYPQLSYHFHENVGLAATRNAGAGLATGSLLALLDSDDEWAPAKLERQVAVLEARPELAALGCHRVRVKIDEAGTELWRRPSPRADGTVDDISFAQEIWSNRICGATMLLRRDVFERHGGYDASMRASEDHDLWLRMLGAGDQLAVLREALYIFYDRPWSLRSRLDLLENSWRGILAKWDPAASPDDTLLTSREYQKVCQWWWLKLTFHALRQGDRERARKYAQWAASHRSGVAGLEMATFLARHWPGLFALVGKVKGFPRPTG